MANAQEWERISETCRTVNLFAHHGYRSHALDVLEHNQTTGESRVRSIYVAKRGGCGRQGCTVGATASTAL